MSGPFLFNQFDIKIIGEKILHNRHIEAIKDLRSITHMGLKESKDVCDDARDYLGTLSQPAPADALKAFEAPLSNALGGQVLFVNTLSQTLTSSEGPRDPSPGTYTYHPPVEDSLSNLVRKQNIILNEMLGALIQEVRETNQLLKDLVEVMEE